MKLLSNTIWFGLHSSKMHKCIQNDGVYYVVYFMNGETTHRYENVIKVDRLLFEWMVQMNDRKVDTFDNTKHNSNAFKKEVEKRYSHRSEIK